MDDVTKRYEIGLMILPRTYLLQRNHSLLKKVNGFLNSIHQLCTRTYQLKSGCAFTGHTSLHSQIKLENGQIIKHLTTGFSPFGFINICRLVMGRINILIGEEVQKIPTDSKDTIEIMNLFLESILKKIPLSSGPGKFSEELFNHQDVEAINIVYEVGPGLYYCFLEMQKYLILKPDALYSFYPDLNITNNCGTAAIWELKKFINRAKNHHTLMGQMQALFQTKSKELNKKQFYSKNQEKEQISLDNLNNIVQSMENIAKKNKDMRKGNQGEFTKIVKEYSMEN